MMTCVLHLCARDYLNVGGAHIMPCENSLSSSLSTFISHAWFDCQA